MPSDAERAARDAERAFPIADRLLISGIILEVVCAAVLPALPLAVFALAFLTPLRRSRARLLVLGILTVMLTLAVIAPTIFGHLGLSQIVDSGPVHRVH